jgi:hypothetical protein
VTHQEPSRADLPLAIAAECERLGLSISPDAVPRLAAYAASLWSWNERLNLTRHTDVEKFVSRDVGDAVAIEKARVSSATTPCAAAGLAAMTETSPQHRATTMSEPRMM